MYQMTKRHRHGWLALTLATVLFLSGLVLPQTAYAAAAKGLTGLKAENAANFGVTDSYALGNAGGNNHVLTDVNLSEFSYSADLFYKDGGCVSLIFGSTSADYRNIASDGNGFFGVEFKREGSDINVKMFRDGDGGGEFIGYVNAAKNVDFSKPVRVKIAVDAGKNLTISVGGNALSYNFSRDDFAQIYNGGYLGMLTYDASAVFSNISIADGGASAVQIGSVAGTNVAKTSALTLKNTGGNNLVLSDDAACIVDYETDIVFEEGSHATLAFGAGSNDPAACGRGKAYAFYGLEVSANGGEIGFKMFRDGPGGGDGLLTYTTSGKNYKDGDTLHVKLSIDGDNNLSIALDGGKIDYVRGGAFDSIFTNAYAGGYLGVLTWNTRASFRNLQYTAHDGENFNTNLSGWRALGGSWFAGSDGMTGSCDGDGFYMAGTTGADFVYTAKVKLSATPGAAASLVFRAQDANNPAQGSYVANIIYGERARLFRFPGGADLGSAALADPTKTEYEVKIVAVGSHIDYYLDGERIISADDTSYSSGAAGLLNFNMRATYQDVMMNEVTDAPKLDDLTITGGSLGLSPEFSSDCGTYTLFAGESETLHLTATAADGVALAVSQQTNAGASVLPETELESGKAFELSAPYGESRIVIATTSGGVTLYTTVTVTRTAPEAYYAAQAYRSQLHFSPAINFMNDPNGLFYDPDDGLYHMYYQYSPQLAGMGNQTWGHAVSDDLIDWEEYPVAIPITNDDMGAVFSGSMVIDENNTSGFFTDNKPGQSRLVAIYTGAGPHGQQQCIAYSKDHGVTWTKYENNPVVSLADAKAHGQSDDFRDPKVYWHDGQWMMVVAGGRTVLYVSEDLKNWEFSNSLELWSECPDFFRLTLRKEDATADIPAGEYWVYSAGGEWYQPGLLKKDGTTPGGLVKYSFEKVGGTIAAPNGVTAMYATQSYYTDEELGGKQMRRMLVSWLTDYSAPGAIPDKEWNGVQSLPLEVGLINVNGKVTLSHYPVREVDAARDELLYSTANLTVTDKTENILSSLAAQVYDVEGVFKLGSSEKFGFRLRTGSGEETLYYYDAAQKRMVLDKTNSGAAYNNAVSWELFPMEGGRVQLRAVVDNSVIETFGNYGEANLSDLFFPSPGSVGMEFFVEDGDVTIEELNIYSMRGRYEEGNDAQLVYLSAPQTAEAGEEITLRATVLPLSVNNAKSVTWDLPEGASVVSKNGKTVTIRFDKVGEYNVGVSVDGTQLAKEATIRVIRRNFNTNLADYRAVNGKWTILEDGLLGDNASMGDVFYVSATRVNKDQSFVFEADVTMLEGQAAGLLLGVADRANPASHWYCLNLDSVEAGGRSKFFKNTGGQNWSENYAVSPSDMIGKTVHMKVEYDADTDTFRCYLNDVLSQTHVDSEWAGGFFGVMTFRSKTKFDNVYLTVANDPVERIVTDFETIFVTPGTTQAQLLEKLPSKVEAVLASGTHVTLDAEDYDLSGVDLAKGGRYTVKGMAGGKTFTVPVTVAMRVEGVTLVGDAIVGNTLTASVEPAEADVVWRWQIADENGGSFADIPGASGNTLAITSDMARKVVRAVATGRGEFFGEVFSDASETIYAQHRMLRGDGSWFCTTAPKDLVFVAEGDYQDFLASGARVLVDGKELSPSDFTHRAGSVRVTIRKEFLLKLSLGKHNVSVVFGDGAANGTFTVSDVPKTGDVWNSIGVAVLVMTAVSALLMAVCCTMKRKTALVKR